VGSRDWTTLFSWTLLVVLAYPLLTILIAEWSRRVDEDEANRAQWRPLRVVHTLLLPSLAIWLVVGRLTDLPDESLLVKLVDTAFGIAVLATLLVLAQSAVAFVAARSRTPRLLFDIALSILVVIGATVIISVVWGFSLASLLSAVGVGSVVMGLALQGVIGGVVSGVMLLSARQFKIGDWLRVGTTTGRVIQVDWRSVTLRVLPRDEKLVLHSAGLATGSFSVIPADQPASVSTSVTLGYDRSPDEARAMLLEAARGVPDLVGKEGAACVLTEYGQNGIRYSVWLAIRDPGKAEAALDELLSRIWYVAQRHGILLVQPRDAPSNLPRHGQTAEERAEMLAATGAFGRPASALMEIAEAARLQRWGAREILLRQGETVNAVFVVLRGELAMFVRSAGRRVELGSLTSGQLFAIREAFRDTASPVEVVASEETEILSVPADVMQALLDHDPALATDLEALVETHVQALSSIGSALAASPVRTPPA
jgi:small-conductance mechanosensitive channel